MAVCVFSLTTVSTSPSKPWFKGELECGNILDVFVCLSDHTYASYGICSCIHLGVL